MHSLVMTAVLVLVPGDQTGKDAFEASKLDGKWLIVYAEEGGRRINNWEQRPATIKEGGLTYERDGKDFTLTLKFGANQTVKVTAPKKDDASEVNSEGVFIAGQDYLSLSLNSGTVTGAKDAKEKAPGSSGSFILILRRQR
jgi:hypothetical protein